MLNATHLWLELNDNSIVTFELLEAIAWLDPACQAGPSFLHDFDRWWAIRAFRHGLVRNVIAVDASECFKPFDSFMKVV